MSKFLTMRWDESLVAAIDDVRGAQTRSDWLRSLALRELGDCVVAAPERRVDVPSDRVKKSEVSGLKPAREIKPPENRCPNPSCSFRAPSPHACCPIHPGKLIPA